MIVCTLSAVFSNELRRPSKLSEYVEIEKIQKHFYVNTARIAWADYDLIHRDFPLLKTKEEIDYWILSRFAYISQLQLELAKIRNTDISVDLSKNLEFAHPLEYYRAAVAPSGFESLVDLKGSGHSRTHEVYRLIRLYDRNKDDQFKLNQIRLEAHSDGLMSLGEGIAEITRQHAIQLSGMETVEIYFLIDWGFDLLKKDGERIPAGVIGRQAHLRGDFILAPKKIYVDNRGRCPRSVSGACVDMGGVKITTSELADNFAFLNGSDDPQKSKPWSKGHIVAREFRKNPDPALISNHISEMLEPLASKKCAQQLLKFLIN